jgi:hypothetical protein
MDHQAAVSGKVTERYLLNELAPSEREEFEEHFFTCIECADDLRLGASFVANAKDVLRSTSLAPERRSSASPVSRWLSWLWTPAPAYGFALLLGMFAYQQSSTDQREFAPQLISSSALRPATRGDAQLISLKPGQQVFQLTADVPQGVPVACTFQKASGDIVFSIKQAADTNGGTLNFLLPSELFPDGSYKLVILGNASQGAGSAFEEQYDFVVRR